MTDKEIDDPGTGDPRSFFPTYVYAISEGWIPDRSYIYHHVLAPVTIAFPPEIRWHHDMERVSTYPYDPGPWDWQAVSRSEQAQGIDLRMDYDLTGLATTAPKVQPATSNASDPVNPTEPEQEK